MTSAPDNKHHNAPTERTIMRQTRHRSEKMVRRYIRDAELFTDNAAAGLL